jgi:hypothetical protein
MREFKTKVGGDGGRDVSPKIILSFQVINVLNLIKVIVR